MEVIFPSRIARGTKVGDVATIAVDATLKDVLRLDADTITDNHLQTLVDLSTNMLPELLGRPYANYNWKVTFPAGYGKFTLNRYGFTGFPDGWEMGSRYMYLKADMMDEFSIDVRNEFTANDITEIQTLQRYIVSELYRNPGLTTDKARHLTPAVGAILYKYRET